MISDRHRNIKHSKIRFTVTKCQLKSIPVGFEIKIYTYYVYLRTKYNKHQILNLNLPN